MTIEEIADLIEKDFPNFEWLLRANSTDKGRYFSNASERNVVYPLRPVGSPPPPFAFFADNPVDALVKTYSALVKELGK